jgi:succinate-semialdehyde dehydrogenase / glutarate-semialdehyde dehydrogenase
MSYQSINPANGETSQTFKETTDQELEAALQTAAACFESWRDLTFAERAAIANKPQRSCVRAWTTLPGR